jgi:hypothetical protein
LKKTDRFGFINLKLKKQTEPKPEKPSQTKKTEPNQFELVLSKKPNRPETSRFEPVSGFF